jgi:DinB superfamily
MSPRLARLVTELEAARRRAHAIAEPLDDAAWAARPAATEWSVAECLSHLNLTSRAFVPLLRDALASGRKGTARCRMDVVGALVWWATTLRVPAKTTESFVPPSREPRSAVLAEFDTLQDQMIRFVGDADGVDLVSLHIVSPFDSRLRYNAYSALRLIPAHQRQHLAQAERAVAAQVAPRSRVV